MIFLALCSDVIRHSPSASYTSTHIYRKREGNCNYFIDGVIRKIKMGVDGNHVNNKPGKFMEVVYPGFYKSLSQTRHLHVENTCIGCGLCAKNCPVNAIEIKDGKPTWTKKNCALCLSCLHRCPKFAIQYDDKTKEHGQYLHPDEK